MDERWQDDAGLEHAISMLREAPPVRAAWRGEILARVAAEQSPRIARRWSMSPGAAIAAGIMCAVLGAGAALLGVRADRPASPSVAQAVLPPAAMVRFVYIAPGARQVSIVGDFNGWNPDALPLTRLADGETWGAELPLAPGRYAYAFVVDGRIIADPSAPRTTGDDFGVPSSVVLVRSPTI